MVTHAGLPFMESFWKALRTKTTQRQHCLGSKSAKTSRKKEQWNGWLQIFIFIKNIFWTLHVPWLQLSSFANFLFQFFIFGQVTDDYTVIGRNLFKKETNLQLFVGLKVTLSTGEMGSIEGGFGQSGKIKIRIPGKQRQMHSLLLSLTFSWPLFTSFL